MRLQSLCRGVLFGSFGLVLACFVAVILLFPRHAIAETTVDDLVSVTKSGLVFNRATNTYDSVLTLKNLSQRTIAGPLRLVIKDIAPASVAVYNSYGKTDQGKDFIEVPLDNGVLDPGSSATVILRLINTINAPVTSIEFSVTGQPLTAENTAVLNVEAFFASGTNSDEKGESVGAGFRVLVDGYPRGITDKDGKLTVQVPISSQVVSVEQVPNSAGNQVLTPGLAAGETRSVEILVGDSGEIYANARLRFDQVRQQLLARNATRLTLRFMRNEQLIPIAKLNFAYALDILDNMTSLDGVFSVQADGSIAASPAAFYQMLGAKSGKIRIILDAEDSSGIPYSGTAAFYFADFKVKVQLVAPPSQPNLPLAGIRITGNILNTDVTFTTETDTSGAAPIPDLQGGNLNLSAVTAFDGIVYSGKGTVVINKNSLVNLVMRGPEDILNGVSPVSVEPLPGTLKALNVYEAADNGGETPIFTKDQLSEREAYAASLGAIPPKQIDELKSFSLGVLQAAAPTSVTVFAYGAGKDVLVADTKQLVVTKGVKKIVLTYNVFTYEYPYYVQAQSKYNDVWSISVMTNNGAPLFDITRQINSQLFQDPVWQPNGSTGDIKLDIDVSALTASTDATIIITATSVNIGDGKLPTIVNAKLDASVPLIINTITPDTINANNGGTYYSIPRSGNTNTLQRTFSLDITKPQGSTITSATVELRDGVGAVLMNVQQNIAPGQNGVEIVAEQGTSVTLRVRGTILDPVSTVPGTPPPTRDLTYRFVVKANDTNGNEISGEKSLSARRSLWRMPDGFQRYGTRDPGGDDWAARGTYTWLQNNQVLLREIDDISGEHGRNIGHQTHARGTDIDMFHFYRFPGAASGTANYNALANNLVQAFQTLQANPPPGAVNAFNRVAAWIGDTRTGLAALVQRPEISQLIYCSGIATQGLPAGWCNTLLRQGRAARTITVNGQPQVYNLNFGVGAYANNLLHNNNIHNNHIHITLRPSSIGE